MSGSSNLGRMVELKRSCRSPLPQRVPPTFRSKAGGSALEHILDMPQDILQHLLSMVDGHSILQFASTCRLLRPARAHVAGLSFRGPCAGPVFAAMPGLTTLSWAIREEAGGLDLSYLVHLNRLSHLSITMGSENADPMDVPLETVPSAAASDALALHIQQTSTAFQVLPNVEELYLLLGNAAHWRMIEPALNQGKFPALLCLRVLFTDFGSDVFVEGWLLPFLQEHTGGKVRELELCVEGVHLPRLLSAIEDGLCPDLMRLRLRLSGPVPLERVLDLISSPKSRLLRMDESHLSIDPYENDSFDELLSLGLWSSGDVYRQQGASLLLGELLLTSFTHLVFLPPPAIHAATTGALRLLADPRLILRKSVLLRLLAELVEESFHATFTTDIAAQAAALATAIEEAIECDEVVCGLKAWHAMKLGTASLEAQDPRVRFVLALTSTLVERGMVARLLELTACKAWDQAYPAVACLDAIPQELLRSGRGYEDLSLGLLEAFVDVGRSPSTFRMNEAFVSVLTRLMTAHSELGKALVARLGLKMVLLALNWPAVKLYMLEGVGGDVGGQYTSLVTLLFELDPDLFDKVKALLLSTSALPTLSCKPAISVSPFLCTHHTAAPRGSLLCRYIITLFRLDRQGLAQEAQEQSLAMDWRGQGPSPLLHRLLRSEEDMVACGQLLMKGMPIGAESGMFHQEVAAAFNILGRVCTRAKEQVVCRWGVDRLCAAVLSSLSCVYFTHPSSPTVIHDFVRFVVSGAEDLYSYANSSDEESYSYYRCGNGRIPRKELLVKGLASLMHRLGQDGNSALLKMLLSTQAGESLLALLLGFLESGRCPQHEMHSIMQPLRCGINRLKDQMQALKQQQMAITDTTTMARLEHAVT